MTIAPNKPPDFFAMLCLFIGFVIGMVVCAINIEMERESKGIAIFHPVFSAPEISNNLPTDSLVIEEIKKARIAHPGIAIRQYKWESAHLKDSSVAMRNNNIFCFKKDTTIKFDSWQESVWYYKIWQKHITGYRGTTEESYLRHLQKYWCAEDTNYIQNLMK